VVQATSYGEARGNEVYRSDRLEPRMSLAAIVCPCQVVQEPSGANRFAWALATPEGVPIYHCISQYNHKTEDLCLLDVVLPVVGSE